MKAIITAALLLAAVSNSHGQTVEIHGNWAHVTSEVTLRLFPFLRDKLEYAPIIPLAPLSWETKEVKVIYHRL